MKKVIIREKTHTHDLLIHKIDKYEEVSLNGVSIPNWQEVTKLVTESHYKLPHFKIINWDIAIRDDAKPIIIEWNLIDASVSFHQLYAGPIFGKMTEEVLKEVFSK